MEKNFDLKEFNMYLNLAQTKAKQTGKTVEFTIAENVFCRVSAITGNASFFARRPKKIIGYASVMTAEQAVKIANDYINKNKDLPNKTKKKSKMFSFNKPYMREIIIGLFHVGVLFSIIASSVAIAFYIVGVV